MLPELPRLIHNNLEHGDAQLRRDLAAMLAEQRQTNRLLSMIVWVGVGFVLGLLAAQLVIRLHGLGVIQGLPKALHCAPTLSTLPVIPGRPHMNSTLIVCDAQPCRLRSASVCWLRAVFMGPRITWWPVGACRFT